MIDTRAVGQELQDLQHQLVGRIRKGQETVASAIKAWSHTAQAITPQIPALPKAETLTARLPKPETLTARLPKPETLVGGAYDLAGQFLAGQRKLAGQAVDAAKPLARQGAAMLGYSTTRPARSHSTATSQDAQPSAKAPTSAKAEQSAKTATARTSTAKTATPKPATAKTASARTTAAKTNTGAQKARSVKK